MSGLLSVRGFIHLMRRSTAAGNANVGIVTRCRCFSSTSVVGTSISQEGAGKKVADSGPRSVVVTETKPEEDEAVKLEICGDIEGGGEEAEVEEMLQDGPAGKEWGGPTRGGVLREPTRF
ncbi:unnamed protein product, partial [Ascophyllum nodosum]